MTIWTRTPVGSILAMLLVACGFAPAPATTSPTPITTTTSTDMTTTVQPTTTVSPSTTTPSLVDILRQKPIEPLPTLADGRPATFVGVTTDYAAVEVDTLTGQVVRPIAQIATAEDVAKAECAACINAISDVWRLADGSAYMVNECCEPAGGRMYWLAADHHPITPERHEELHALGGLGGWFAEPVPAGRFLASVGYFLAVDSFDGSVVPPVGTIEFRYAASPPAWSWDLSRIFVLVQDTRADPVFLSTVELDSGSFYTTGLSWWGDDSYPSGLGMSADGWLVTFERARGDIDRDVDDTTSAVVFNPDGTFVRDFPVEPGSSLGGFDPTGTYLIYVDGQGSVRWHDTESRSGGVADGFFSASW